MNNYEWATCDTCGCTDMCIPLGNDEHICVGCESAPRKQKEYEGLKHKADMWDLVKNLFSEKEIKCLEEQLAKDSETL